MKLFDDVFYARARPSVEVAVLQSDLREVDGLKRNHWIVQRVIERIEQRGRRGLDLKRAVAIEAVVINLFYDPPVAFARSEVWNDLCGLLGAERLIFEECGAAVGWAGTIFEGKTLAGL